MPPAPEAPNAVLCASAGLGTPGYKGGRPPKFTLAQRREIKEIAKARPVDHDLPFSTWSLSKLADFLVAQGVIDDISHEGLRALLREEVLFRPHPALQVICEAGRRDRRPGL